MVRDVMRRKKKASLPGLSQSLLLIPNWDSWVNQTHCRGLLWFPSWEVFRRSSSEDASCQTSFGLLSSLFSKFCPCGEAAGFSQQTKLDISIPCARFWSAWSCFPAVALSTVFYSLSTVPLETFSPPRLFYSCRLKHRIHHQQDVSGSFQVTWAWRERWNSFLSAEEQ